MTTTQSPLSLSKKAEGLQNYVNGLLKDGAVQDYIKIDVRTDIPARANTTVSTWLREGKQVISIKINAVQHEQSKLLAEKLTEFLRVRERVGHQNVAIPETEGLLATTGKWWPSSTALKAGEGFYVNVTDAENLGSILQGEGEAPEKLGFSQWLADHTTEDQRASLNLIMNVALPEPTPKTIAVTATAQFDDTVLQQALKDAVNGINKSLTTMDKKFSTLDTTIKALEKDVKSLSEAKAKETVTAANPSGQALQGLTINNNINGMTPQKEAAAAIKHLQEAQKKELKELLDTKLTEQQKKSDTFQKEVKASQEAVKATLAEHGKWVTSVLERRGEFAVVENGEGDPNHDKSSEAAKKDGAEEDKKSTPEVDKGKDKEDQSKLKARLEKDLIAKRGSEKTNLQNSFAAASAAEAGAQRAYLAYAGWPNAGKIAAISIVLATVAFVPLAFVGSLMVAGITAAGLAVASAAGQVARHYDKKESAYNNWVEKSEERSVYQTRLQEATKLAEPTKMHRDADDAWQKRLENEKTKEKEKTNGASLA